MKRSVQNSIMVGEVVTAVFDEAAQYSADPQEVTQLATQAVAHMLRRRASTGGAQPGCGALRVDAGN